MANIAAKTSTNVFFKARCEASKQNGQLSSREGAADIMSIDRGRLYRIESGIANPYPEEIHLIDFCGIEEETFKLLELELNNMIFAMKATKEALGK